MINHEFNEWGFVEGTDFEGLMPKAMDILGDDYCVGTNDEQPVVSIFNPEAKGVDPLKVISVNDIMSDAE